MPSAVKCDGHTGKPRATRVSSWFFFHHKGQATGFYSSAASVGVDIVIRYVVHAKAQQSRGCQWSASFLFSRSHVVIHSHTICQQKADPRKTNRMENNGQD